MKVDENIFSDNMYMLKEKFGEDITLIPIKCVAKMFNVDYRSLAKDKSFPTKKICSRYYVEITALARWLAS